MGAYTKSSAFSIWIAINIIDLSDDHFKLHLRPGEDDLKKTASVELHVKYDYLPIQSWCFI